MGEKGRALNGWLSGGDAGTLWGREWKPRVGKCGGYDLRGVGHMEGSRCIIGLRPSLGLWGTAVGWIYRKHREVGFSEIRRMNNLRLL